MIEAFVESGTTKRTGVRAIGLVEACLEDDAAGHVLRESRQVLSHPEVQRVVFQHTRARNQEQRSFREEHSAHERVAATGASCVAPFRRLAPTAAAMKPENNGWGRVGRD